MRAYWRQVLGETVISDESAARWLSPLYRLHLLPSDSKVALWGSMRVLPFVRAECGCVFRTSACACFVFVIRRRVWVASVKFRTSHIQLCLIL